MAMISKRRKEFLGKYDLTKPFALNEALDAVKACANAKFDESVDVAIQLGIDPRKSDQAIRGAVVMPEGTGKTVRDRKSTRLNSSHNRESRMPSSA